VTSLGEVAYVSAKESRQQAIEHSGQMRQLTWRSLSARSRKAFCSGLGVLEGFSDDHWGLSCSFSPRELSELTLVPGVGVC
jgi:hypothetical protein